MDETVDSLKIKIDVEVPPKGPEKIEGLSTSLNGLKESVKGVDTKAMNAFGSSLGKLSTKIERIAKADGASKAIGGLVAFLKTLDSIDTEATVASLNNLTTALGNVGQGFKGLSGTGRTMNGFTERLGKLLEVTQGLNLKSFGETLNAIYDVQQRFTEFAEQAPLIEEKVPIITKALGQVATVTNRFSNGLAGVRSVSQAFYDISASTLSLKDLHIPASLKSDFDKLADFMGNVSKQGTGFRNLAEGLRYFRTTISLFSTTDPGQLVKTGELLRTLSESAGNLDFKFGANLKNLAVGLKTLVEISKTDIGPLEQSLQTVSIALQSFAEGVARRISDKEIGLLKDLGTSLETISKSSGNFAKLAEGFKTLNGVTINEGTFSKIAEQLKQLSEGLKGVDFKSGEGLKNLARGLSELSKVGSGNQKNLAENLNNARIALEQFMKDLGTSVTDEEMARFNKLAESLGNVAEGYRDLAKAKEEAAKDKGEGIEGVTGSIVGSLGELPFVGKFIGQISSSARSLSSAFKAAESASGGLGAALGTVAVASAGVLLYIQEIKMYIDFVNNEFDKLSKTLIKVADTLKSFTSGVIDAVKGKLDGIGKAVSKFVDDLKSTSKVVKDVGKTLSNVFDKFTGGFFKNFEKSFKNIFNMIKRMALRKAINAIFKDINDSFENLVAFSRKHGTDFADSMDMFATSAKYLNNSLVAMVSPIINMVMPVFDALVDKVVELMNVFNQLFSRFSGADMWTKAIKNAKQYGEEAEKSSKKQKKLNNAILSFDEIHKLNGDNGKGKDFEASDLEDWTFEINSLDDLFDFLNEKLKSFISTFKDYLDSIDWEKIKSIAYDLGEGVMKLLNTIFGDEGLAIRLGRSLAEIVNTAFAFALGAIDEWDPKAWGQSFVAFFIGIFDNLDWTLIRMTFENFGTKLAEYFNTIFSAEELFEKLGKTLSNGFNSVLSGVSNFVKDIDLKQFGIDLGITFRETFGNIDYSMLFTTLTTLLNKVFQALAGWVSESDLPNVAEKIGNGLTEGLKNISWTDVRQGVLGFVEDIDESINTLLGNSELMSEVGKNIANGINTIKSAVAAFWEGLDAEKVGGGIGTLIDSFLDTRNLEGKLMHLTELPQKILRIVAEAFKNIHTADLGKRIGQGLTNAIKNINLDQIGTDLSTIAVKIGDFFGNLLSKVDFKGLGEKASGLASKLLEAIAKMLEQVDWGELATDLADGFNTMLESFFESEDNLGNATSIVDNISTFLGTLFEELDWNEIIEDISTFIEKLPLEDIWNNITKFFIKFWEAKSDIVKAWVKEKISGILSGIIDSVKEEWNNYIAETDLGGVIFDTLYNIITAPMQINPLGHELLSWLGLDAESIRESLSEISLDEWLFDAVAFANPVTHFAQNPITQEFLSWLGLDNDSLREGLKNAFEGISIDLSSIISGGENVGELGLSIGDAFERAMPKIKELAGMIKNSLQPAVDVVKNAFDTIKTAAKKIYNYIKNAVDEIEDSDLGEVISSGSVLLGGAAGYVTNKVKKHATGMQGGVILNRGTVFGMDGDTRLVGGEAGKEAVVGVGSLSTMIQSSVLGAISPMSMSTAVEAGVRSAMQGGGTSPVVDVTLKCDSETLFRMVKQGQTAYNGRYHFVEEFA